MVKQMAAHSIIGIDTHVTEAPDLRTGPVPAPMREAVAPIRSAVRSRLDPHGGK
jgi:hypothetical protein